MIKVVVLTENKQIETKTLSAVSLLDELQTLVGGYLQLIPFQIESDICAYCNEEGALLNLPINEFASLALTKLGFDMRYSLDYVFGPVVLIGPDDGSLSDRAIKRIKTACK
jgi:hypothetical protein